MTSKSYQEAKAEALAQLRAFVHDDVTIVDDGDRVTGPGGTTLVNGHGQLPDDVVWIDRRSKWGNPFVTENDGGEYSREESVDLYRGWFLGHVEAGEWDVEALRGETLACWCVPRLCHGLVILNYLAETYDPQQTLGGAFDAK
ncbi:DUF4326 domain-containing protein [Haloarcula pellucida]|uniref:DUF4326 domain-containing protein n=1 Tax=Haloarcula pellucida TaxID=1427151 RepID=A0A830GT00_9EURY|nr:DUF4326 domain-containing protein [Halomicroarcula pellucida]MBX0350539.1 DUF4326 domain-containing protein [Halomicroarcula pellucida]GGO03796.1 hypothetical protein GCM10009030_39840 [Halomicroarcula pellucida]